MASFKIGGKCICISKYWEGGIWRVPVPRWKHVYVIEDIVMENNRAGELCQFLVLEGLGGKFLNGQRTKFLSYHFAPLIQSETELSEVTADEIINEPQTITI